MAVRLSGFWWERFMETFFLHRSSEYSTIIGLILLGVEMKPGVISYVDTHCNSLGYKALCILHEWTLLGCDSQIHFMLHSLNMEGARKPLSLIQAKVRGKKMKGSISVFAQREDWLCITDSCRQVGGTDRWRQWNPRSILLYNAEYILWSTGSSGNRQGTLSWQRSILGAQ